MAFLYNWIDRRLNSLDEKKQIENDNAYARYLQTKENKDNIFDDTDLQPPTNTALDDYGGDENIDQHQLLDQQGEELFDQSYKATNSTIPQDYKDPSYTSSSTTTSSGTSYTPSTSYTTTTTSTTPVYSSSSVKYIIPKDVFLYMQPSSFTTLTADKIAQEINFIFANPNLRRIMPISGSQDSLSKPNVFQSKKPLIYVFVVGPDDLEINKRNRIIDDYIYKYILNCLQSQQIFIIKIFNYESLYNNNFRSPQIRYDEDIRSYGAISNINSMVFLTTNKDKNVSLLNIYNDTPLKILETWIAKV